MRLRFTLFLFILFLGMAASQNVLAATTKVNELLKEANLFYADAKDNLALQKFEEVLKLEPGCYEALWKSSLLNSRIGSRYGDVISKLNYYEKAWNYADQALCAFPGAEANYVMALAIYNKALALNVRERMQNTHVIKFYLDEALCANPEYADAWQLMGRWHFKNANLNMAEKSAVNLFFGGVPLDASNERAIVALQNAIRYNPSNISYYFDLACVYRELENEDLSITLLQDAVNLKLLTSEELEISRRCKAMLDEMNRT